uniref:Membrane associated guanylate kinase, WW and PDZ domain containing 2 n=1 Tax=Myotis myotis TaxID=51298 RepID=A0A7J7V3Y6_MYOMY|nr:membrane associated guanylate kinase, WW and PDZ domain containing 2 [Myotis myotis]
MLLKRQRNAWAPSSRKLWVCPRGLCLVHTFPGFKNCQVRNTGRAGRPADTQGQVRRGRGAGTEEAGALQRPLLHPRGQGPGDRGRRDTEFGDEPGAWSGPAAAAAGLQEVGAPLEDVLSPFSPSHPAPPSDPSHQRSPDPTGEIQREHDVRKPKELAAGGQKKQRPGAQRERSASPRRAARPRLEEAPGGQGRPEAGRPPSEARAPGRAAADAADTARAGGPEGPRAAAGPELGRREGPGAAPGFAGPGGGGGAREAEGRAGARAGPRPGARPPGGAPARKAAVAPGPWKVPGSDKLSGVLQPGASAAGR